MFPLPAALFALLAVAPSAAQASAECQPPFTRDRFVQCVLHSSINLQLAEAEVKAAAGRLGSASALLPTPPELALQGARRSSGEQSAWNGYVTLSQKFEVGGQRGLRIDAANADKQVVGAQQVETRRTVALSALRAWFDLHAAEEQASLGEELADIAAKLSELAKAQSAEGLISGLDENLARAQAAALELERQRARRELRRAKIVFGALVRNEVDTSRTAGEMELPPAEMRADMASQRADLIVANAEVRAAAAQLSLVERSWVPSPTVSGFVQNDGFNERVLGIGLSLPLPTPSAARAGQVEEQRANEQRARSNLQLVELRVATEMRDAVDEDAYRQACLRVIDAKLAQRARADLLGLSTALAARELPLREALLAQSALVDLLRNYSSTRAAAATARLQLIQVAALPIPGVSP